MTLRKESTRNDERTHSANAANFQQTVMPASLIFVLIAGVARSGAFNGAHFPLRTHAPSSRLARPVVASAKVVPIAYTSLGATLLLRATSAQTCADTALYITTGTLALFNLAVTDNARLTGAKRALAIYSGRTSLPGAAVQQLALATKWYEIVRLHLIGQLAGLGWMARATSITGALAGAATFMGANVAFFLAGAGPAKHDPDGRPAPIKPAVLRFVVAADALIFCGALVGALATPSSMVRTVGLWTFVGGATIGAVEGLPKFASALKSILQNA